MEFQYQGILFIGIKLMEIVNKLLLTGDKFMPEINLRQPGFTYSACGSFTKNKERIKKIKEVSDSMIQEMFNETNLIVLAFNMIWLMEILKIYLEEQPLIKYCTFSHLILPKIQNMIDIKAVLV